MQRSMMRSSRRNLRSALVVLPGGITDDGKLSRISELRARKALEVWRSFDFVVVCGKHSLLRKKTNYCEADSLESWLVEKGVPMRRIIKETDSTDTVLNFLNIKEALEAMRVRRATIVTSQHHSDRSRYIASKVMPEVAWSTLATDQESRAGQIIKERIVFAYTKTVLSDKISRKKHMRTLPHQAGIVGKFVRSLLRLFVYHTPFERKR